jgi:hypothetical protein
LQCGKRNSGGFSYTALSFFTYQLREPVLPPSKVIGIGILLILIKGDLLTVHCILGTFPTKDVSKKSDMAVACMTHCNAALDCGAIFIQVPTVIFFGVLTYIANTLMLKHSSCDEKLFLSV